MMGSIMTCKLALNDNGYNLKVNATLLKLIQFKSG